MGIMLSEKITSIAQAKKLSEKTWEDSKSLSSTIKGVTNWIAMIFVALRGPPLNPNITTHFKSDSI